jgi:hypothetical protein
MPREGVEASLAAARAARLVREAAAATAASPGLIPVLSLPVSPAGVAPLPRQFTAVGHTSALGPLLASTTVAQQPAASSLPALPLAGPHAPVGGLPSSVLRVPSADSGVLRACLRSEQSGGTTHWLCPLNRPFPFHVNRSSKM